MQAKAEFKCTGIHAYACISKVLYLHEPVHSEAALGSKTVAEGSLVLQKGVLEPDAAADDC